MRRKTITWTDDRLASLRSMFANPKTAPTYTVAAQSFGGGITRNAVKSKVDKLRRAGKIAMGGGMRRPSPQARNATPAPPKPRLEHPAPGRDADGALITVRTVHDGLCRWPHGDPRVPGFHLCGLGSGARVYCDFHSKAAVARVPLEEVAG